MKVLMRDVSPARLLACTVGSPREQLALGACLASKYTDFGLSEVARQMRMREDSLRRDFVRLIRARAIVRTGMIGRSAMYMVNPEFVPARLFRLELLTRFRAFRTSERLALVRALSRLAAKPS